MTKRMLIDASHPEETRVVVIDDQRLEEFDFESSTKKQLKGNIYLAKVTRVEPSLQAAFVDYGGQRHGFLAFSEIHPDYYQIPHADRKLLEAAEQAVSDGANGDGANASPSASAEGASASAEGNGEETAAFDPEEEAAEVFDEQAKRRSRLLRSYKIQEVIKRRQILLVQVVKEERGNKGAALTTYISLAGRYGVLMPNTARGGGISRKIANSADRTRLKSIIREIEVPEGMGLIIRTAGQSRSKLEIRRDYEYSLRLWNDIRELTLKSIAPCTIHEEGALVKRAVRDLYSRDIDEVLVEGEEGYRSAKKVMGMLMPSRARRVKPYKEDLPLFHRFGVEEQLDALHDLVISLRSGGSIVIHTTEALTAIDVNSGRSTRERNIEETALKTNTEAAIEIARQLRLRDIAGLVVIDFIDMTEGRNQRAVERKLREQLKSDRARVQLGRISSFGLLELSRQRLRPSFQELSAQTCPTCDGLGTIRSVESAALQALRAIELEGLRGRTAALAVTLPLAVALYLLNQKRDRLNSLEARYDMTVDVRIEVGMIAGRLEMETLEAKEGPVRDATKARPIEEDRAEVAAREAEEAAEEAAYEAAEAAEQAAEAAEARSPAATGRSAATEAGDEDEGGRKRRRRRRRRRRADGSTELDGEAEAMSADDAAPLAPPDQTAAAEPAAAAVIEIEPAVVEPEAEPARPRRRSRRRRTAAEETPVSTAEAAPVAASAANGEAAVGEAAPAVVAPIPAAAAAAEVAAVPETAEAEAETKRPRRRRRRAAAPAANGSAEGDADEAATPVAITPVPARAEPLPLAARAEDEPALRPARAPAAAPEVEPAPALAARAAGESAGDDADGDGPAANPRRGWWSRFVRKED